MHTQKRLPNSNVESRLRQLMVLIVVILAGVAISSSLHAQKQPNEPLPSFLKPKHKFNPQAAVDTPVFVRKAKKITASKNKILIGRVD
ncbi:MAG: hypothetical protein ACKOE5_06860 [Cytophagales bacterium]